jgi:glutamyl-tRNA reductase
MHLVLVGTSHQLAPVELRELLAFDAARGGELARLLAGADGESVALSTCNRTCLYLAHEDVAEAERRGFEALRGLSELPADELSKAVYVRTDSDAALHLFRVAAGLDSLVPGEAQILGQVRQAYEAADSAGAVGPLLHRLFRQALHAGKRVRTETEIGENPASVSSAAAELVASVFEDLTGLAALVIGAGKTAELTVASLVARGVERPTVVNRSPERASALAERFGGRAAPLEELDAELARTDVVVSSTGSQELVLTAERAAAAIHGRRGRPIFFIDIAVPRDLDPAINDLDGCYLYDIDDLERVVAESVAGRLGEAARAETIVAEEAESFRRWLASLDVVPAIASLRALAEDIRASELARAERRLGPLSDEQRRAVETLTSRIVEKLLHRPTVRMKQAAAAADGVVYADAVRHLFGLEERSGGGRGVAREP